MRRVLTLSHGAHATAWGSSGTPQELSVWRALHTLHAMAEAGGPMLREAHKLRAIASHPFYGVDASVRSAPPRWQAIHVGKLATSGASISVTVGVTNKDRERVMVAARIFRF